MPMRHARTYLRQAFYLTILDGDAFCLRTLGQARHAEHVAGNGHNHLTTQVQDDITDADCKTFGGTIARRIGRKGELCLGYTDGIVGNGTVVVGKDGTQILQFLLRRLAVLYARGTIDALAHLLNLVFQAVSFFIGEVDR